MKVITAKVLDSTHLELTEPLTIRSGSRVAVTVESEDSESAGGDGRLESSAPPQPPQLSHRHVERAWRQANVEVLQSYAGRWVVLEGEQIIAAGDDPAELVAAARGQGIRSPYVFYVELLEPGVVTIGT